MNGSRFLFHPPAEISCVISNIPCKWRPAPWSLCLGIIFNNISRETQKQRRYRKTHHLFTIIYYKICNLSTFFHLVSQWLANKWIYFSWPRNYPQSDMLMSMAQMMRMRRSSTTACYVSGCWSGMTANRQIWWTRFYFRTKYKLPSGSCLVPLPSSMTLVGRLGVVRFPNPSIRPSAELRNRCLAHNDAPEYGGWSLVVVSFCRHHPLWFPSPAPMVPTQLGFLHNFRNNNNAAILGG